MRSIRDDLETIDEEQADRLDRVLRLHRPDDHASRIIGLADAPEIHDEELID